MLAVAPNSSWKTDFWPEALDSGDAMTMPLAKPAPSPGPQLMLELFVRDLDRSRRFYLSLGFQLRRSGTRFAELAWDQAALGLYQPPVAHWAHVGGSDDSPRSNVRILVREVDLLWRQVSRMPVRVLDPLSDKPYGMRDFMIADTDGFGLRFATPLPR